jgi:phospholipase C
MTQFLEDAKQPGGLASYTFIEPNMLCSKKYGPENDMHPAYAITDTGAPTDVRYGESLVHTVYEALRESPDWDSTLLVITFDEHGGCYDHVPPSPACVSPDGIIIPADAPGGSGFNFKRYGVRVPAVLVSPLIEQGTVCNTVFDHTSIIRTVANRWLDGQHLTERDREASDVGELLTLSQQRGDDPQFMLDLVPPFNGCGVNPLSDLHRHLLAASKHFVEKTTSEVVDLTHVHTTEQAVAMLDDLESKVR